MPSHADLDHQIEHLMECKPLPERTTGEGTREEDREEVEGELGGAQWNREREDSRRAHLPDDVNLYRKLIVGSAWRKQMPKLAVSLGLGDKMPDMIEELISRGQQLDAVHFTYEVGLVDKFPTVPLLKAFLKDARKAAASILDDPNNPGRAVDGETALRRGAEDTLYKKKDKIQSKHY
ncbi:FRIGIDA-like protein 4a [Fagus crenata]